MTVHEFRPEAWPTAYHEITQHFGVHPERYDPLPGHEGLDIRAPSGSPIYAVASGVVYEAIRVEDGHNYGLRVRIRSGPVRHIYAHLLEPLVRPGQLVEAGQRIGRADNTGRSFGSHLHLTLQHDEAYQGGPLYIGYPYNIVDPTPYLEPLMSYPAVVNLLPPVVDLAEIVYVVESTDETRETITYSADDAIAVAANGHPYSAVKVWAASRWPDPIGDYLAEHGVPVIRLMTFPEGLHGA